MAEPVKGMMTANAPAYTGENSPQPLSLDANGQLRVSANVTTASANQTVIVTSGNITLLPGTANIGNVTANITAFGANISMAAFQPLSGNAPSVTAAVGNTSATLNIPTLPSVNPTMRVTIDGNQTVAWAYGNVTATMNGSVQMLANTVELFAAPTGLTQISHIAGAVGSNIRVTIGAGGTS